MGRILSFIKDNKNLKIIAVVCFATMAVLDFFSAKDFLISGVATLNGVLSNYLMYIFTVLHIVGNILVVIALLTDKPALSVIGFALWAADSLNRAFSYFRWFPASFFYRFIYLIVPVALSICLIITCIHHKSAKNFGFVAAILAVVRLVIQSGRLATNLWWFLLAVGAMLLGFVYYNMPRKALVAKPAATKNVNAPAQAKVGESNVERIMRLKSFLDEGVITQEEFDEKKKQLLGM